MEKLKTIIKTVWYNLILPLLVTTGCLIFGCISPELNPALNPKILTFTSTLITILCTLMSVMLVVFLNNKMNWFLYASIICNLTWALVVIRILAN
jgi:hypothetical protein